MNYIASVLMIGIVFVLMRDHFGITNKFALFAVLSTLSLFSLLVWWNQRYEDQARQNKKFREKINGKESVIEDDDDFGTKGYKRIPGNIEGRNINVALFVRPFTLDCRKGFRNPRKDSWITFLIPFYRMTQPDAVTLDDTIGYILCDELELVAIGDQTDALGATRYETNEQEWRDRFLDLAIKSRAIIVFLSTKPGTLWEISQICESVDLTRKAVFIVPPAGYERIDEDSSREKSISMLVQFGYAVPLDAASGEGLVFGSDKNLICREKVIRRGLFEYVVSQRAIKECIRFAAKKISPYQWLY